MGYLLRSLRAAGVRRTAGDLGGQRASSGAGATPFFWCCVLRMRFIKLEEGRDDRAARDQSAYGCSVMRRSAGIAHRWEMAGTTTESWAQKAPHAGRALAYRASLGCTGRCPSACRCRNREGRSWASERRYGPGARREHLRAVVRCRSLGWSDGPGVCR